jgi:hypothetical protein
VILLCLCCILLVSVIGVWWIKADGAATPLQQQREMKDIFLLWCVCLANKVDNKRSFMSCVVVLFPNLFNCFHFHKNNYIYFTLNFFRITYPFFSLRKRVLSTHYYYWKCYSARSKINDLYNFQDLFFFFNFNFNLLIFLKTT